MAQIHNGEAVTLNWSSTNATALSLQPGIGSVSQTREFDKRTHGIRIPANDPPPDCWMTMEDWLLGDGRLSL